MCQGRQKKVFDTKKTDVWKTKYLGIVFFYLRGTIIWISYVKIFKMFDILMFSLRPLCRGVLYNFVNRVSFYVSCRVTFLFRVICFVSPAPFLSGFLRASIIASLVPKWSSCSFLWSSYHSWVSLGREMALPLFSVDLVPRVGGFGRLIFFGNALD